MKLERTDKPTIHLGDREEDDTLHITQLTDDEHHNIVAGIVDEIERQFRTANGGEEEKMLCGGCVMATMSNVMRELMRRGDATFKEAAGWARTMKSDFENMERAAMVGQLRFGGDGSLFEKHDEAPPEPKKKGGFLKRLRKGEDEA